MRNSKIIREASKAVFEELLQMPSSEFHKMLDGTELGEVGLLVYESLTSRVSSATSHEV